MASELDALLRCVKPHKTRPHKTHPGAETLLLVPDDQPEAGPRLLLDSTVYVDALKGNLPPAAERLLSKRHLAHSAVCLAELSHVFGRLDPADPRTSAVLAEIRATIADIRPDTVVTPTSRQWMLAGILCGTTIRLKGTKDKPSRYLNDALLCCQAEAHGLQVLTRNAADFGMFNQLLRQQIVIAY